MGYPMIGSPRQTCLKGTESSIVNRAAAIKEGQKRKTSPPFPIMIARPASLYMREKNSSKSAFGIFLERRNLPLFFRFPELESDHESGKNKENCE